VDNLEKKINKLELTSINTKIASQNLITLYHQSLLANLFIWQCLCENSFINIRSEQAGW